MASTATSQPQRRLGTRVRAQIPLRITSVAGEIISQNCHTLMVNPQGCAVRCARPLEQGLQIRIEDLPGRGSTMAKVACNRPLEEGSKFWIVGIAIEHPGNLWLINPVPEDWGPYAAPPKFVPMSVKYSLENTLKKSAS
jgi:hypothetical protein